MINPMSLNGRHVVVTGASSGIGAEVARHAARLGAHVSLIARNETRLKETLCNLEGEGHAFYPADLHCPEQIESVLKLARKQGGRFDGAVYCAGVNEVRPLKSTKPEKLANIISVNYLSFVEFVRCVCGRNNRSEKLSVVGISSVNAERGDKGKVAYCSSKAAMNGAMRAAAHEMAASGVRVNNVLPGWVRTPLFDGVVESLGEENMAKEFELLQYMGVPLEPLDVANAVVFLLSDAAKGVTGTEMVVGGGYLS